MDRYYHLTSLPAPANVLDISFTQLCKRVSPTSKSSVPYRISYVLRVCRPIEIGCAIVSTYSITMGRKHPFLWVAVEGSAYEAMHLVLLPSNAHNVVVLVES